MIEIKTDFLKQQKEIEEVADRLEDLSPIEEDLRLFVEQQVPPLVQQSKLEVDAYKELSTTTDIKGTLFLDPYSGKQLKEEAEFLQEISNPVSIEVNTDEIKIKLPGKITEERQKVLSRQIINYINMWVLKGEVAPSMYSDILQSQL